MTVRSVAAFAALGLSLTTVPLGTPVAFAQNAQPSSLILQDTGKLTIHKHANPDSTKTPTGEVDPTIQGEKLQGVEFTITKINNVDLKTNEGLAKAAGLTVDQAKKNLGAPKFVQTTNANGEIVLTDLPIGAYLVQETKPKEGYTPAADFIAFVPMTKGNEATGGTSWNYDVHAYPKNYSKKQPEKQVVDRDQNGKLAGPGDVVNYYINTQVRKIQDGKRLSYYFVEDSLDKTNFDVNKATVEVAIKTPNAADFTKLTEGADYTLVKNAANNSFRVAFTAGGLKKLESNTAIRTGVAVQKLTNKQAAPNQAVEFEPNNPNSDWDVNGNPPTPPTTPPPGTPGTKTNIVESRWGELKFQKVDGAGAALAGAEFKIVQTKPGTTTCEAVKVDDVIKNDPKSINGFVVSAQDDFANTYADTFVSNKDGQVSVSGLHVTDWVNGKAVDPAQKSVYCLVETKAPAGKELLSKPLQFELVASNQTKKVVVPQLTTTWTTDQNGKVQDLQETAGSTTINVPVYQPASVKIGDKGDGKVVNLDDTTPNLPLTGGAGIVGMILAGLAIVFGGAFWARRNAKSQS
ncbi:SpaH/EbpB family LPXTG-anchored major pilin [Corynebacterium tapiri]|uniref:LPXTG cell wall anchor domain-containing protein n=1 Tax=Corynebacterium tapiri TaxID=1448266 RepID=A0A5C4U741_9CORY|nr:SpaH/EbpB family LPXTG-anchored major pilin [Corynebacterium tapiri]TNL99807.1 LPXTG cell wall anchor domain-containing protein [Corynebacterium tapiri]